MNKKEKRVVINTTVICVVACSVVIMTDNAKNCLASQVLDAPVTASRDVQIVTNMVNGKEAIKIGNSIVTLTPRTISPTMPSNSFGIGVNIVTASPKATVKSTKKPVKTASPKVKEVKEVKETKLYKSIPLSPRFQKHIEGLCKEYGISTNVAMAVIARESDFNIDCTGDQGRSKGLMQVMECCHKGTMKKFGISDLYNCWDNVTVGIDILATCYKDNGENWHRALMAYNGGQGYCDRRVRNGKYSSDYSVWVMNKAEKYKEERGK